MQTKPFPNNLDLLCVLRSADMQLTSDQGFAESGLYHMGSTTQPFTKVKITDIFAVQVTGGATVACTGGIYTASAKGGIAIVSAAQSWLGLTGADKVVKPASNYDTDIITLNIAAPLLYLSLTTGSTGACTADIFVFGFPLY